MIKAFLEAAGMRNSKGTIAFAVFALAVSAGCVRLGFWQIERHTERRARNAEIMARLGEAPLPVERVSPPNARFRRAVAEGVYDFSNEFVLTSRGRNGAPGVHIITPLRVAGSDTAVLVNRGWAYTPDGMKVDLSVYREDSAAVVDGYAEEFSELPGPVTTPSVARAVRRLNKDSIASFLPYPVRPVVLVQQRDSGEAIAVERGTPVRVEPPRLDIGPHRSYAIQWFGFALVGIAGTALVLRRNAGTKPVD